jgi:hypothetical protein
MDEDQRKRFLNTKDAKENKRGNGGKNFLHGQHEFVGAWWCPALFEGCEA